MSLIIAIILLIIYFCIKTENKTTIQSRQKQLDNDWKARKERNDLFIKSYSDPLFEDDCLDEVVAKGEKYCQMRDKIVAESGYTNPPDGMILLALMGERGKISTAYIRYGIHHTGSINATRERDRIRIANEMFALMKWYDDWLVQHGVEERLKFKTFSERYPPYYLADVPDEIKRYRGSFVWIDNGAIRAEGTSLWKEVV